MWDTPRLCGEEILAPTACLSYVEYIHRTEIHHGLLNARLLLGLIWPARHCRSAMAHLELNPPLVDCTNTSAMFDQSCWQTLDIPGYLGNNTGWAWTMPTCDTSSSASYNGIGRIAWAWRTSRTSTDQYAQAAVIRTRLGRHAICDMDGMAQGQIVRPSTTNNAFGHRTHGEIVCLHSLMRSTSWLWQLI